MNDLEKANELIDKGKIAEFFAFMEECIGIVQELSLLKETFLQDKTDVHFIERLRVFAKKHLDNTQLSSFNFQPSSLKPPFLTSFVPAGEVIGRQEKLDELHRYLQAGSPTVVVNGIGGIGKTTLARKYAQDYQTHYQHIIWLEQSSSLLACLVRNEELTRDITSEGDTETTRLQKLLAKLQGIKGNNLLVIDNYAHTAEDEQHKILACLCEIHLRHWRILLTSREKVERLHFKEMRLDTLAEADAIALFRLHCGTTDIDETELKTLLQLIKRHTLLIEILAKNYAKSWDFNRIAELTDVMQRGAIDLPALQEKIWTEHSQDDITLYPYLLKMFDLSAVGEDGRYILQQLAVLPTLPIAGKDLLQWIADDSLAYKPTLQTLAEKGWLTSTDNRTYEMHRLVQMLVLNHLKPTFDTCENLYDSFMDLLDMDKVQANPLAHQWLLGYGEALLAGIHFDEKLIWKAYLQERLARLYEVLGIYTQAERLYEDALHLLKEKLGTQHEEVAAALNNLALLYHTQGKYAEAEPLYREALQIGRETIGTQHLYYAMYLNNLAGLYYAQVKYAEAESLYLEALQIGKETIGIQHPHYAIRLNNLALLYKTQGKYAKAEPLYKEALQIDKETIGTQHPNYATDLYNLGCMYYNMEQYEEAKALLTEAYTIQIATLGEQHLKTQNTKEWLELVEAKL